MTASRFILVLLSMVAYGAAAEPDNPERDAARLITPQADRAIERGLAWLVSRQNDDGTLGDSRTYRGNVAVVSLTGMAIMSAGSLPNRGPHGDRVARCLDFVLAHCQESGYIVHEGFPSYGPMYGHGFATMFLAECCGNSSRADLRPKLAAAVALIVRTQNEEGGWRYMPERVPLADVSVTVTQVMALRAARNAGVQVPRETIDRAIAYIRGCQNPDGGFAYMRERQRESAFPRSAAAIVGLYSAGVYQDKDIARGLDYVMRFVPQGKTQSRERSYYFYGHYYAAVAMWQAGGDHWNRWFPAIRDELIALQQPNGSWADSSISPEFDTAMACLILQVPNNYLPIFQR